MKLSKLNFKTILHLDLIKKTSDDSLVTDINGRISRKSSCSKLSIITSPNSFKTVYIPIIYSSDKPLKEGDIYYVEIDGNHYKYPEEIVWLDNKEQWIINNHNIRIVQGYYLDSNNEVKVGRILKEELETVTLKIPGKTISYLECESDELAEKLGYVPSLNSEIYYNPALEDANMLRNFGTKSPYPLSIRTTHYADNNNPTYVKVKEIYERTNVRSSKEEVFYHRLVGKKSFGLEFETTQGNINPGKIGKLGLVPLIDGSIGRENYEYTSIPMIGPKGITKIKEQCEMLTKYSGVNSNCAFHVHIGGIPDDRLTFVSLFALCSRIEDEMYALFPYYKQHEVAVLGKQKEYSRKLPYLKIDENTIFRDSKNFEEELNKWNHELFSFFSCDELGSTYNRKNRKIGNMTTKWREKWHCPTRYYWVNFINYLFNSSGTIEFRIHEPTVNFTKVSAFILLISAIVRYAEKYPKKILLYEDKIRLRDIVEQIRTNFGEINDNSNDSFSQYANSVADYLLEYISFRKEIFIREGHAANRAAANNQENSFNAYGKLAKNFIKMDCKFVFTASDGRTQLY